MHSRGKTWLAFALLYFALQGQTCLLAPTINAEEAEVERFYEDLQDLLELTLKNMSFSL